MGDIINLRTVRKNRARAADQQKADANRALHGRSKSEKQAMRDEALRAARLLDGAKREPD